MKLVLSIIFSTLILSASAQQISGSLKDETGVAMNAATVSLLRAKDSAMVKFAVSDKQGNYKFQSMKEGDYRIMVSSVGYKPVYSSAFALKENDVTVPDLTLAKLSSSLTNVTVTARKPLIEMKADRTVMNVEGTINATGSNALELLRKSPGVLLDKDENISMSGKNGVQVYIDGRSTPLSGLDLAAYLKSIPSAQIESIELITNPSAKYDAAGNAGIINIRMVKNKSLGFNANVNAGWNIATYAKYNAGLSFNFRSKWVNLFGTYNYSYNPNEQTIVTKRNVADSLFDQTARLLDKRRSHNIKAGADYFINKKNTIGIMVNAILADPTSLSNSNIFIVNENTGQTNRVLVAGNNNIMKRHSTNLNLNYSYTDGKGKSLAINADQGIFDFHSDQMQFNNYYNASGQPIPGSVTYHMKSPSEINISSVKVDYEQNFLKGKLSLGMKTAWITTDNDFIRSNVMGNQEDLDEERSNHFIYKENINALYATYSRAWKGVMFQAGLRTENTVSKGTSRGLKNNGGTFMDTVWQFRRPYTDLFPSASITFNKNPMKQWTISVSRRIDRPSYKDLNPFEFKLDEYTFMKGNINLRPQYTNNISVAHTYKFKLNMALNYSHVNDMFAEVIDTLEKTKAFVSKKNLATQDIIGFNISYPYVYKSYTLFTNITTNYSMYKADFGSGRKIDLDAFGFNLFMQHSLKFKKTWTAELSGFFNAPTISGTFKTKAMGSLDAGLSKQIFKGRGTIKAAVSDIFYTMRFRATSDFAGQKMNINYAQESRQFKLSMTMRFGNNGVKPARQRVTGVEEETKRTN